MTRFPEPIRALPLADIPLPGVAAFLSQGESHQVLFMEFTEDAELPEHSHAAQVGIVVAGEIELTIGGETRTYGPGGIYHIPAGALHSGRIKAGYADVTFFAEAERYAPKQENRVRGRDERRSDATG